MASKPESLQWYDDGVMDGLQMAADITKRCSDMPTFNRELQKFVAYLKLETKKKKK